MDNKILEEFERLKNLKVGNVKPTEEEIQKEIARSLKIKRIEELKQLLSNSDYQAIKYAEGLISESEYAGIKTQRQELRDEINTIQSSM